MIHNNKVYANADEKFVKGTMIYVDAGTAILYYDRDETLPVYGDEIEELFFNGVILHAAGGAGLYYYKPTGCKVTNGEGKLFVGDDPYTALARPTEE